MNLDLDYIQKNRLGMDDTFEFECRQCGQCCHNRDDLVLTAYDIFRIARHLSVTPLEVIKNTVSPISVMSHVFRWSGQSRNSMTVYVRFCEKENAPSM